jgi:ligand-binding sensor domain-containing protein/signal transduction histidine kinase
MSNRLALFFCMYLYTVFSLCAMDAHGSSSVRFRTYTVDDGLLTNSVYSIYQDSRGILWLGTQDGINFFDGNEFSVIGENSAVSSGYVNDIIEDSQGDILISSTSGLFRYRQDQEVVEPYDESLMAYEVLKTMPLASGALILSLLDKGVFVFDEGKLTPLFQNLQAKDLAYKDDLVYMATEKGLIVYNLIKRKTEDILLNDHKINSLKIQGNLLWAGSDHGIILLDLTDGTVKQTLGDDFLVTTMVTDDKSGIWMGTASGGLRFYQDGAYNNPRTFEEDSTILSLYIDRSDNLWVGVLGSGLKKIDIHRLGFSYLGAEEGLDNTIVVSLWEDEDQSLWIGTFGGGLYHYSSARLLLERFVSNPDKPGSLGDNRVMGLFRDSRNRLWIGTKNNGLFYKDGGNFIPVSQTYSSVYTIAEDQRGRIWAITQGGGVHLLSQDGTLLQTLKPPLLPSRSFRTMMIQDDRVYLGSVDAGLIVLDLEGNLINHFSPEATSIHGLSGAHVISLLSSEDGTLWVGTATGGLHRYDPLSETFQNYTTDDGMPNNTVYGILEDGEGRLWTSTNKGLALISPESMDISIFTMSDGLQSNEFNSGASLRGKSGTLFMGGVGGLSYFDPEIVETNKKAPETLLSGLSINNKKISVKEKIHDRILLPKALYLMEELKLTQDELVITFHFRALHYSEPEKNSYAYYLEGLEPDWNYTGNSPNSTYTKLAPGSYRFHYKTASSDGFWSQEKSLKVVVESRFYQTLIFKVFLVIVLLGFLLLLLRLKIRKTEEKTNLLEERVKERTMELEQALNREKKMRDVLNVGEKMSSLVSLTVHLAHNLNTPLGSSLTALSFLKTSLEKSGADPTQKDSCDMALEGTKQAVQIVNQLSSASSAQALPTPVLFNLSEILDEYIGQHWSHALRKTGIHCILDFPKTEHVIQGSISSLQEILDSLIGNSLQHAFKDLEKEKEKKISLKLVYSDKEALLIYRDNGKGIKDEVLSKIFEPYEGSHASGKTGVVGMGLFLVYNLIKLQFSGSISSVQDTEGACFHIRLPLIKEKRV